MDDDNLSDYSRAPTIQSDSPSADAADSADAGLAGAALDDRRLERWQRAGAAACVLIILATLCFLVVATTTGSAILASVCSITPLAMVLGPTGPRAIFHSVDLAARGGLARSLGLD